MRREMMSFICIIIVIGCYIYYMPDSSSIRSILNFISIFVGDSNDVYNDCYVYCYSGDKYSDDD